MKRFLRRLSSAVAAAAAPQAPVHGGADSLYRRVAAVANPRVSVAPVLEAWAEEGRPVRKHELQSMVKQMVRLRRYSHALEISMWMTDRRHFYLSPGDVAYRLELMNKVHGLEHAVSYFDSLPKQLRVRQPFGSLLNCYVEAKFVQKAEDLFKKMEEMGLITSYVYNAMMKLYSETGQPDKVHATLQVMEEKGIEPDVFTIDVLLSVYAAAVDVEGIEKTLEKAGQANLVNWHTYAAAARGFIKAGVEEKALQALKESEKRIDAKGGRVAYGFLLSTYAEMGIDSEVQRIWDVYRSKVPACNSMYMCRISVLLKMNDIEGAEEAYKEWESKCVQHDFRIPNLLVGAYSMAGLMEKAEALVNDVIAKGRTPFANTWYRLASGYFKDGQVSRAVDMTKKALASAHVGWKPDQTNVLLSLEHFMEEKNLEAAEEMASLLQRLVPLTRDVYHCLLKMHLVAGLPVSDVLDRMKKDGIEADEETDRILAGECC